MDRRIARDSESDRCRLWATAMAFDTMLLSNIDRKEPDARKLQASVPRARRRLGLKLEYPLLGDNMRRVQLDPKVSRIYERLRG